MVSNYGLHVRNAGAVLAGGWTEEEKATASIMSRDNALNIME